VQRSPHLEYLDQQMQLPEPDLQASREELILGGTHGRDKGTQGPRGKGEYICKQGKYTEGILLQRVLTLSSLFQGVITIRM
jgi:hypothetical protein